ncbi:hypothetical protein LguiB_011979 [Lonicera macranthoides]
MAFQDFDLISDRVQNERKRKLQKRITIATVSIVLLIMVVGTLAVVMNKDSSSSGSDHKGGESTKGGITQSHKAIKIICDKTDYKEKCVSSLETVVEDNPKAAQPKDLLAAAINVVSDEIDKAMKQTSNINFDSPEKKKAYDVCKQVLNDAKEELNSSVATVKGNNMASRTADLDNWLSAVVAYQQTCIDAMPKGETKTSVEKALKNAKELTSNSLAIVSQVSSVLSTFKVKETSRRLLADEEGFPEWMNDEDRRMLKADVEKPTPNVTVAKDGSGDFKTINGALAALPKKFQGRYVIYVKEGVYEENVIVTKDMVNITIYGEGSQKSIVTGSKNYKDGVPTFQTATFAAIGEGFMAQSIGFRNTAGPEKHQAVALRVQSDRSIFLNCRMEAYQDTLYAQTHRQFYKGCYITGTIDFIFGDAAAIFQNCMIYVRKPADGQKNIVTAQGRADKRETTGIVLQNCRILADDKLEPEKSKIKSYLGRPWKEYSRTIVMESEINDLIDPQGWLEWEGDFALKTLYYAEYNNKGPRADVNSRVKWPGYKGVISKEEAAKYTVVPFIQGESWLKAANVPVRLGLSS